MFAFLRHRSLTFAWRAIGRIGNVAVSETDPRPDVVAVSETEVESISDAESDATAVLETGPRRIDVETDLSKFVFRVFGELQVDGKMVKIVAFQGSAEDWMKLKIDVQNLYFKNTRAWFEENITEDITPEQRMDAHARMQENLSFFHRSFITTEVIMMNLVRMKVLNEYSPQPALPSKIKLWSSQEASHLLRLLQILCSRFQPGGLADCAYRFCEAYTLWFNSANECIQSWPEGRVQFPCLFMEVINREQLAGHTQSADKTTEFQLFVELEPTKERFIAFKGNLDKWRRFLERFEKQLTRRMRLLERNYEVARSQWDRLVLCHYKFWQPFLKEFCESSSKVETLLLNHTGPDKVLFLNRKEFCGSIVLLHCAPPWRWVGHSDVPNLNYASSTLELLECLQSWFAIHFWFGSHPVDEAVNFDIFLEVLTLSH